MKYRLTVIHEQQLTGWWTDQGFGNNNVQKLVSIRERGMNGSLRMGTACEDIPVPHNAPQRTFAAENNKIFFLLIARLFPQSPTSNPLSPDAKHLEWQGWKLGMGSNLRSPIKWLLAVLTVQTINNIY